MSSDHDFAHLNHVEPCGSSSYRGTLHRTGAGRAFGGQALGQVMTAAGAHTPEAPWALSLHAYFISALEPAVPVVYDVDAIRDGGRHRWRHVTARQGDRVCIAATIALATEPTPPMSVAAPTFDPQDLPSAAEEIERSTTFKSYYERIGPQAFDVRYERGTPLHRMAIGDRDPHQELWLRPHVEVSGSPQATAAAIAYLSDVNLLSIPLIAAGMIGDGSDVLASSFDHVLRFHHLPDRLDWLQYRQRPEALDGARPEASGHLVDRSGTLVATVSQQGLLRDINPTGDRPAGREPWAPWEPPG